MSSAPARDVTLPAAIVRLRKLAGSHDKFAADLGTSRQTVIRWENGAVPQAAYRRKLIALGVAPDLFDVAETPEQIEERLRTLEAEIAAIRDLLEDWP